MPEKSRKRVHNPVYNWVLVLEDNSSNLQFMLLPLSWFHRFSWQGEESGPLILDFFFFFLQE